MFSSVQKSLFFLLMLISTVIAPLSSQATDNPVIVRQSASNTALANDHQIIRTSSGRLYYITGNAGHTTTWDGWIEVSTSPDGTSWTPVGSRDQWHSSSAMGAAVDSRNIGHFLTYDWNNHPTYTIFHTADSLKGDHSWGTAEILETTKSATNGKSAIAVDANDNPHVVYMSQETYKGSSYTTLTYAYRISGVWNRVIIWPKEGKVSFSGKLDIAFGPDNTPYILAGNKLFKGNGTNATAFEAKDLGSPCYSMVIHDSGDVRVALAQGGIYANYLHDHTQPWASGWMLSTSTTPDSGGILLLANNRPYLARLLADGIWLQRDFEPPQLVASQPFGVTWQSLTSRWSRNNLALPGLIDLGTRSFSTQTGNQYWYTKFASPTEADFSATPLQGIAPLLVSFTDKSTPEYGRSISSWEWDFNKDGVSDATTANPAYRFDSAGKYQIQLKVTDSFGGTATKTKSGYIEVVGDADNDGIPDNLDNCPNDYNPLQIDLNKNGIGDTCEVTINMVQKAEYMTGLRSITAADKNIQNVTSIMTDGLINQSVILSYPDKKVVSIQMNKDARDIKKLILSMYTTSIEYNPYSHLYSVLVYASGLTTPVYIGLSGGWDGWSEMDLTPILHNMDGYGAVKFRIIAGSGQVFNLYEIKLREAFDNKEIGATPETVNFGTVEAGKSSTTTVRISNNGIDSLNILKVRPPSSPFSISSEQCSGKTLGSSGFCELSVAFSPAYNSNFSDILRIDSTDADKSSLRVSLQGTGALVLNGTVKDAATGYPMSNVAVTVIDSVRTSNVVTDTNGTYSISGMPAGDYTASFARSDYQPLTQAGTIRIGENNRLDAALSYKYATINGVVKDQSSEAPLSGVAVTLKLSGIKSKDPVDLVYSCSAGSTGFDPTRLKDNDGLKTVCGGTVAGNYNSISMKARNPFGIDPFTITWNGISALAAGSPEYLAQSFKTTKSGKLTRASLYIDGVYDSVGGYVHVLLKSKLGGDRGSYLAVSSWVSLKTAVGISKWVDFDFPAPVDITAGQEYYLEINGTFFNWIGSSGYLFDLPWRNAAAYPDGKGYERVNGIWNQSTLPLAFRTYIDGQVNVSAQESTANITMYGGNTADVGGGIVDPKGYSSFSLPFNWDRLALDNDGEHGWNGDDLTASGTYSDNPAQYYDVNGWVQATVGGYAHVSSALASDQFTISFSRSLTAVTDASGAFSFPSLPEGSYTLSFSKIAYADATAAGQLAAGQNIQVTKTISLAQPATLRGTVVHAHSSAPVTGAVITLNDPLGTRTAVTDNAGNYLIGGIVPGNYSSSASADGYESQTASGSILSAQTAVLDYNLYPSPITVTVIDPVGITTVYAPEVTIRGRAENALRVSVHNYWGVVGSPVPVINGDFSINVPLAYDNNYFSVVGENDIGSTSNSVSVMIYHPYFMLINKGDVGHVTIMEFSDKYNAVTDAYHSIAQEFIKSHGDTYDFLVFLTSFDRDMPFNAKAYYQSVKNDVQGIGYAIYDYGQWHGSSGKLQGTIDMGKITILAANPYDPKLDETVTTLNHELMHRFGAYVGLKNPDGSLNTTLLGKDNSHWSYLLDSKGSLMYGSSWQDNKNGTYTATSTMSGYSPLDLYLMGMIPKEQVPPMTLIENPEIDKTQIPQLGATISGTPRTISINDIIAAEGERLPNAATAQKQFKVGFVLLVKPGENPAAAATAVETLRSAWAGKFAELTRGKGSIADVAPSLSVQIDSPTNNATIIGPDVTVTGMVINSTGAETGVTVNGIPATIIGSHFIVNHVPLTEGNNTLTVTATDANGLTTTTTRAVTTQAGHYLRITPNIDSGTGPLDISFRINGSFSSATFARSASGPVPVTIMSGASPEEFIARLVVEGMYTFNVSATAPDGNSYTDSVTVTVVSKSQLETLLQGKWEGMKTKIFDGDTQGAGSYFPVATRERFQNILSDPAMEALSRLNEISSIEIYTVANDTAQGGAVRQESDGEYAYPINFTRDDSGIWCIYGF